jgi:hypothetical protein
MTKKVRRHGKKAAENELIYQLERLILWCDFLSYFLDAAVTAFRKKVQRRAQPTGAADGPSMDVRRNLERYVGRRQEDTLTIQDQVGRYM